MIAEGIAAAVVPEAKRIRIGEPYQARVVDFGSDQHNLRGLLPDHLLHSVFADFVQLAASQTQLKEDQILGILQWNDYDTVKALDDVVQFYPNPGAAPYWSEEEIHLFEKALVTFGKRFHLVAQQVGSKSAANCVRYYYEWKKTRKIDEVITTFVYPVGPILDEEPLSAADQAIDPALVRKTRKNAFRAGGHNQCGNCSAVEEGSEYWPYRGWNVAHLCKPCADYWIEWGRDRPIAGQPSLNERRQIPTLDVLTRAEMIEGLTGGSQNDQLHTNVSALAAQLSASEVALRELRQKQSQYSDYLKLHNPIKAKPVLVDLSLLPKAAGGFRTTKHALCIWSDEEIQIIINGLKTHGRNFVEIVKDLGSTKSLTQVRNWYHNYRKKYDLDQYTPS